MVTELRPWSDADRALLHRANEPGMTVHIGASETTEQVEQRHENYLRYWREGTARMFAITLGGTAVGGIGWWTTEWRDEPVHETGWFVVPEAQGHGVGAAATSAIVQDARDHGTLRLLTAFPSVDNIPSNLLCERAGFSLEGTESFPFRGVTLTVNAWAFDLSRPQ